MYSRYNGVTVVKCLDPAMEDDGLLQSAVDVSSWS